MGEKSLGELSVEPGSVLSNMFINALGKGWRKERWGRGGGQKRDNELAKFSEETQ